jgi:hypothetical protein
MTDKIIIRPASSAGLAEIIAIFNLDTVKTRFRRLVQYESSV